MDMCMLEQTASHIRMFPSMSLTCSYDSYLRRSSAMYRELFPFFGFLGGCQEDTQTGTDMRHQKP